MRKECGVQEDAGKESGTHARAGKKRGREAGQAGWRVPPDEKNFLTQRKRKIYGIGTERTVKDVGPLQHTSHIRDASASAQSEINPIKMSLSSHRVSTIVTNKGAAKRRHKTSTGM